jgi:hypothetical protein
MGYGPNRLPEDYGRPIGRLWRFDPGGSLHEMDSGFVCGNGLAWSPDSSTSNSSFLKIMGIVSDELKLTCVEQCM